MNYLVAGSPKVSRCIVCHCTFFFNKMRVECRIKITSCALALKLMGFFWLP